MIVLLLIAIVLSTLGIVSFEWGVDSRELGLH
jgi:nitrogen fixation-related uncharacterized protein